MSFTIPAAGQDEPEVAVPCLGAGHVGRSDAAELMTLVAELIDASRDGVIRARIEALLDAQGRRAPARPPTG